MTSRRLAPEVASELQSLAHGPIDSIVTFLRERSIDIGAVHGLACELPVAESLPLYRALFELHPTLPESSEGRTSQPRIDYAESRTNAVWGAMKLDDVPLAIRLLEPMLPLTGEFPFVGRTAAWALVRAGRPAEALLQVKAAVEAGCSRPDEIETAEELAALHEDPAFQQIFFDLRDRRVKRMLRRWPAGVPIPLRLLDLARFITTPGTCSIGDYEESDLDEDYLAAIWAQDERGALMTDFETHPPKIVFFLQDGGGGGLGYWMHGEPSEWPVVTIDHEGTHEVLGESLDDFLCMMAGVDEKNADGRFLVSDDHVRTWLRSLGLTPYERPMERFPALTVRTLEFQRWCAEEQRSIRARVFPGRPLTVEVKPGVSVGPIRLGAPQSDVDALFGTPHYYKTRYSDAEPTETAFYDGTPYVVDYDRATRTVSEVTIHADWPLLRFSGGFEPLFATIGEAERWLEAQGCPYSYDRGDLICPSLGLTLSLTCHPERRHREVGWVSSVKMRRPLPKVINGID